VAAVPPPRLHVLVARSAPVAVVFARTRGWWHVAAWDLQRREVRPGAWLKGTIYPHRSAISPDGTLLYTFAMKRGRAYHAVSRAPWLTALALWFTDSTYHTGCVFSPVKGSTREDWIPAQVGDAAPLARKHGLQLTTMSGGRYPALRLGGWSEHPTSEPRAEEDVWDERRRVVLARANAAGRRLVLTDDGYSRSPGAVEGRLPRYHLEGGPADEVALPGVTWADWDAAGRLAVATADGEVQLRDAVSGEVRWRHSFVGLAPEPRPPPPQATRW
jgi:hypothetical protein